MRTYEEIARDLFKRRDEQLLAKKQKRNAIIRTTAVVAGLGAAAAVAIGVWANSGVRSAKPGRDDDTYKITTGAVDGNTAETTVGGATGNEPTSEATTSKVTTEKTTAATSDKTTTSTSEKTTTTTAKTTETQTTTKKDETEATTSSSRSNTTTTKRTTTSSSTSRTTSTTRTNRTTTVNEVNPTTSVVTNTTTKPQFTVTTSTVRTTYTTTRVPNTTTTRTTTSNSSYISAGVVRDQLATLTDNNKNNYQLGSKSVTANDAGDVYDWFYVNVTNENNETVKVKVSLYKYEDDPDKYRVANFNGEPVYYLYRKKN